MTKTIFISSFHGHISRNILSTDVLPLLKQHKDIRVVILVPAYKADYFRDEFAGGNVVIEGINQEQASKTLLGLFFKRLGVYLFDSSTTRTKRYYMLYHYKKWFHFLFFSAAALIGHSFLIKKFSRYFDLRFCPKGFFAPLIKRYNPDMIFSTDIQNENDVSLMQDARLKGISILGMVRSWDNMTQRACRIFPDKLLVGSLTVKEEVLKFHKYSEEKIAVVGNPHYDRYLKAPITPKEKFFKSLGLNPNQRLIVYNPIGDPIIHKNDADRYIMQILGEVDAQILVRLPTNLPVNLDGFRAPLNMIIDRPGFNFRSGDIRGQEITREDDDRLIDSLYYSDIVVSGPSTICLDAALLDKPVITVDFYPTKRHLFDSVYAYQYEHLKKLLSTKGVYHTQSKEDFLRHIRRYLNNPRLDKEGREAVRSLWFSHTDGNSSERIVQEIFAFL